MQIRKRLRRFKNSSAAFTAILVAIIVATFGTVLTQIPHSASPTQSSPVTSSSDERFALQAYAFCVQGKQIAYYAVNASKNVVLNSVGSQVSERLERVRVRLAAWFKAKHRAFAEDGRGMPRDLLLPAAMVKGLSVGGDRNLSRGLTSLFANLNPALVSGLTDPELKSLGTELLQLGSTTSANLKVVLN